MSLPLLLHAPYCSPNQCLKAIKGGNCSTSLTPLPFQTQDSSIFPSRFLLWFLTKYMGNSILYNEKSRVFETYGESEETATLTADPINETQGSLTCTKLSELRMFPSDSLSLDVSLGDGFHPFLGFNSIWWPKNKPEIK